MYLLWRGFGPNSAKGDSETSIASIIFHAPPIQRHCLLLGRFAGRITAGELLARWLESNLTSYAYSNLRSLHLEWDLFVMTARFSPSNLRRISITISKYLGEYLPDYYRFEKKLERLFLDLPNLEEIRVLEISAP
jgi:hypothetical protein